VGTSSGNLCSPPFEGTFDFPNIFQTTEIEVRRAEVQQNVEVVKNVTRRRVSYEQLIGDNQPDGIIG
jgi:hypothetical protein